MKTRKQIIEQLVEKLHQRGLLPHATRGDVTQAIQDAYEVGRADQRAGRYDDIPRNQRQR